jgi:hypothetical protein
LVSEGESVLQGDTRSDSDVGGATIVGELLAQGDKVGSLYPRSVSREYLFRRCVTYKVDLRRVSELLLSIGTFRRVCRQQIISEGLSTISWNKKKTYLATRCSATPGGHPYCAKTNASSVEVGCGREKEEEKKKGKKIGRKDLNPSSLSRIQWRFRTRAGTQVTVHEGRVGVERKGECWSERWEGTGVFVDEACTRRAKCAWDGHAGKQRGGIERKVERARVWVAKRRRERSCLRQIRRGVGATN